MVGSMHPLAQTLIVSSLVALLLVRVPAVAMVGDTPADVARDREGANASSGSKRSLTVEHRRAVDRTRRIIMQYDINCHGMPFGSRGAGPGPELRQESIDSSCTSIMIDGS